MEAFEILLVEDNPGYVRLMTEALKEDNVPSNLSVVMDGIEALSFLRRENRYAYASLPDLILLDLNMPKKNGYEVLAEIKNDPDLRHIPVVVMTTSNTEEDILTCYDLNANCYIVKPIDLDRFMGTVRSVVNFWFGVVKLMKSK
ncbi:response regulator with CheY-like receiver domain and winged-helix DNA-binding domain [Candidatus Methanoperedens nitroreducens]|uniref:Response regulator with CheY-like receiver domain and winged-helix DNA-binding domain n=1 Tax=Candidatus Methanoperedens nitratireducens TaxID=1392998 RepID=A0A062V950_9EURY|nr:response regulator [Candidatus Methanoperedens nitroreducens]KCZ71875.1 response regulator with CheY-like receiver domain and winged-helix DNA-binding domain [Candidatus Methanoperedens nitroreducens]MDJ1422150.1 response regulator [Candidatus Methanoperedens sp.]